MGQVLAELIIEPICKPVCKCCNNFVRYNLNGCTNSCSFCGWKWDTSFPHQEVHESHFNSPHNDNQEIFIINSRLNRIEQEMYNMKDNMRHRDSNRRNSYHL